MPGHRRGRHLHVFGLDLEWKAEQAKGRERFCTEMGRAKSLRKNLQKKTSFVLASSCKKVGCCDYHGPISQIQFYT